MLLSLVGMELLKLKYFIFKIDIVFSWWFLYLFRVLMIFEGFVIFNVLCVCDLLLFYDVRI